MTPPIPASEPTTFFQGDTVQWTRVVTNYSPADANAWALHYGLAGASSLSITCITDPANAGGWRASITAAQSAGLLPGGYRWQAYVVGADGTVTTVDTGEFDVTPAPAYAVGNSQQSDNERLLAAVVAVLEKRVTNDVVSYTIEGRSITKMAPAELMKWRNSLQAAVNREKRGGSLLVSHAAVFEPTNHTPDQQIIQAPFGVL